MEIQLGISIILNVETLIPGSLVLCGKELDWRIFVTDIWMLLEEVYFAVWEGRGASSQISSITLSSRVVDHVTVQILTLKTIKIHLANKEMLYHTISQSI